jgi:hypothetical protein
MNADSFCDKLQLILLKPGLIERRLKKLMKRQEEKYLEWAQNYKINRRLGTKFDR